MNGYEPYQDDRSQEVSSLYVKKQQRKERRKNRRNMIIIALVCAILGGLVGGGVTMVAMNRNGTSEETAKAPGGGEALTIKTSDNPGIVEAVAAKALPSVVGITTQTVRNSLFGPVEATGCGSGFIVSKDGYIATNAHVVDGGNARNVSVLFYDGTQTEAKVLWADSSLDLAVIKVDGQKNLQPATLGDSAKLNIGEPAIAIGNPMGMDLQRSVTSGVISGLDRTVGEVRAEGQAQGNYMDGLIQTDASINQGNSGGPLLNKNGEVVGINTVKISSGEGLGFSIPINTVKPIVEQVIETGTYETVTLGISGRDVATILQQYNVNLGTDHGVMVYDVLPGYSAAESNLKAGDIIVKVGDKDIEGMAQLKKVLYDFKAGDTVTFTFIRDGKTLTTDVTFKETIKDNGPVGDQKAQPETIFPS